MGHVNIKSKSIPGRGNGTYEVGACLELSRSITGVDWAGAEQAEESNREEIQKGEWTRVKGHHESFAGLCTRWHVFINFSA